MNRIRNESEIFNAAGIQKIEELKNAKYVCETCVRTRYPDGPWADQPVAIFMGKEAHPVSGSKYFGIYVNMTEQVMIVNAQSAVDEPITGVIADNGDIIYSRYRHDFRKSEDGSVFIDGGRDYVKSGLYPSNRFVTLIIEDGKLVIDVSTPKD